MRTWGPSGKGPPTSSRWTPPWALSLPAQVAAVHALQQPAYYADRYRETDALRAALSDGLRSLGPEVVCGGANFLLCRLPEGGPDADALLTRCRAEGLYLRDVSGMGEQLDRHVFRVAVKDAVTQRRMLEILGSCR